MKSFKQLSRRLIVALSLLAFILVGFKGCVYYHHLSFIPKDIGVWQVTYSKEKSWGFGPGANETGVIVYRLPKDSAEKIKAKGIAYFSSLKPDDINKANGIYKKLQPTPLTFYENLLDSEKGFDIPASNIDYYLNKYGFGIEIDAEVKQEINKAISAPGNFYAEDWSGIIIIAPEMRKVFYIYAG